MIEHIHNINFEWGLLFGRAHYCNEIGVLIMWLRFVPFLLLPTLGRVYFLNKSKNFDIFIMVCFLFIYYPLY